MHCLHGRRFDIPDLEKSSYISVNSIIDHERKVGYNRNGVYVTRQGGGRKL